MDYTKTKQNIIAYAKMVSEQKLNGNGNDFISVRTVEGMLITKVNADFDKLTLDDIIEVLKTQSVEKELAIHLAIYFSRADINAIYHTHPAYANAVSKVNVTIPAVLDDVAQIVGETIKVTTSVPARITSTLNGRNSCMVLNNGAITTGRTLDEAFTCLLVLEKGAKCFVLSSVIGKAKPISTLDAKIMRFVYKKKYSKQDQSEKIAEEQK